MNTFIESIIECIAAQLIREKLENSATDAFANHPNAKAGLE